MRHRRACLGPGRRGRRARGTRNGTDDSVISAGRAGWPVRCRADPCGERAERYEWRDRMSVGAGRTGRDRGGVRRRDADGGRRARSSPWPRARPSERMPSPIDSTSRSATATTPRWPRTPNVESVYVATPQSRHIDDTLALLQAGKHVLCEKPFALNAGQARRMVEDRAGRGLFLMEAIWSRFLPSYRSLVEVVGSGRIGEPLLVEADFGFRRPSIPGRSSVPLDLGGGGLLDLGIYPLQLCTLLLGPIRACVARRHPRSDWGRRARGRGAAAAGREARCRQVRDCVWT